MEIGTLVLIVVCNVLWITGVWAASLPGQVLDPIATWMAGDTTSIPVIEGNAPDWINKPLFLCPTCMASFHGILFWAIFQPVPWYFLPLYVVCLSGLMKITSILVLNKDTF